MINWEELRHIHVIKKLEAILAQWFDTDLFFVDERGQVRNWDPTDRKREYKNHFSQAWMSKEPARAHWFKTLSEWNEKLFHSSEPHMVFQGPLGFEQFVVSRVAHEGDFLGSVVAYCYIDKPWTPETKAQAKAAWDQWGFDPTHFEEAIASFKVATESERKYFQELVDLVSQEIVTFHAEISKREDKINDLSTQLGSRYSYDQMIGKSKPMQAVYGMLDKIKNSESTVLVQGENGTGKELIARAIHFNSPRRGAQFVTVNCSAFNENLLDSELFGHVKGAFTGAIRDKKGLFESADRGTLFLDEIGDMSPTMQVKLLRVIQEGTLTPVGGTEQRKVDVRVVAATNKNLKDMIEDGTFREDLYYRINVINLVVPPLRERKEDIPLLVDAFLSKGCKEKEQPLKTLQKRTLEKIFDFTWPGNIRQLENEIERLIVLSGEEQRIPMELLSQTIREFGEQSKVQGVRVAGKLKDALEELEKTMIREGLRRTNWNKSRLAKELGISRAGLIMKVERYGLDKRKLARGAGEAA